MLKKLNSLSILAILTAIMVVWMLITIYKAEDTSDDFSLLFPELFEQLSDVDNVTFKSEQDEFTLSRADKQWFIADYHNYPADDDLVRRMLVDMADARILELKTNDPELYPVLGVEGAEQGGSSFVIKLFKGQQEMVGLILGEARDLSAETSGPQQFYVRRINEDRSYLAEGYFQFSPMMLNWIDGLIVDIARERVARVDIIQPNGNTATLINLGQKDKFGTPEDREDTVFRYEQLGYDIAGTLYQMRLEDVQPVDEFSRGDAEVVRAEFLTYDGLKIIAQTSFNDGFYFSTFKAEFAPDAAPEVPEAIASLDILKTPEQVQEEVTEINAKVEPWVYRLGGFVGNNLMRAKADIVTEQDKVIPMPAGGFGQ
ncbi:DUF4340 domain-containing protein [Methylophaga nitratireducenticrescens]|uniref:DUF4340 domain-containing protein n=1 Tax=Methylophaga nitratireducenticrescens TaxID=754476 RepID=I1XGZ5_METNJ|nr:DUF4340 domain-containing protein [Methylophaga nitratireducenticrescens]AFI83664.1 hypothetical protein Q7A_819 [Methylophaga nitratireducenticrescens]AUZ83762.1 hypothetical protein CDW43_03885 [Methylophaga nitratireducenticrescens]